METNVFTVIFSDICHFTLFFFGKDWGKLFYFPTDRLCSGLDWCIGDDSPRKLLVMGAGPRRCSRIFIELSLQQSEENKLQ